MPIQEPLTTNLPSPAGIALDSLGGSDRPSFSELQHLVFQPTILAGAPDGIPPDSPDQRVDPNTTTSPFAGVGSIRIFLSEDDQFLGSGTPISRRHILTAGHLLDVVGEDGVIDPTPEHVTFYLNYGSDLSSAITASALHIFPGYAGFSNTVENDLAIITLSSDLPEDVPIYALNRQPLLPNSTITMVGYGTSGNGVDGQIPDTASFDVKRSGKNQIEDMAALESLGFGAFDGAFLFDFDGSDESTNLFSLIGSGLTLGNDIEATVGPGDSGGPSFIQNGDSLLLAGVNTFAFALPGGFGLPETSQGTFGTGGGGVLVSNPAKLSWIDSILASELQPASIQGIQWNDLNGNGTQEAGEPGLADWTVYLDLNQNGSLNPGEPNTLTDANGNYTFTNLQPGTYTVANVPKPGWEQTFPGSGLVEKFNADFSELNGNPSLDGFTIDNTGAPVSGLWHLSTGRGNNSGHSADDSLYFGSNETSNGGGNYNVGHTAGRVTSPVINLQGITTAELAFNYFLNVEIPPESDQPRVRISRDGGAFQTIGAKPDVLQSVPNPTWRSATLDLTAYVGSTIQLQFDFDTVDNLFNNLEGWYIDDVVVRGTGNGSHQVQLEFGDAIANLNFGDRQTEDSEPPTSEPPNVESDFNNDGKADIVWRNQADGTNLVWLMDGSNQIGMVTLPPIADPNWEIQGTGDLNGDSKADIVWRNQADGTNLVWLMDGSNQIGMVTLPPIADPNWEIQGTGDLNGDSKADIVWRNQADGTNLVWLMDGTVQIGQVLLPPITDPNWQM